METKQSQLEKDFDSAVESRFVQDRFLEMTRNVRSVILSGNFKTAGELLEDWFEGMPTEVMKELGIK